MLNTLQHLVREMREHLREVEANAMADTVRSRMPLPPRIVLQMQVTIMNIL